MVVWWETNENLWWKMLRVEKTRIMNRRNVWWIVQVSYITLTSIVCHITIQLPATGWSPHAYNNQPILLISNRRWKWTIYLRLAQFSIISMHKILNHLPQWNGLVIRCYSHPPTALLDAINVAIYCNIYCHIAGAWYIAIYIARASDIAIHIAAHKYFQ